MKRTKGVKSLTKHAIIIAMNEESSKILKLKGREDAVIVVEPKKLLLTLANFNANKIDVRDDDKKFKNRGFSLIKNNQEYNIFILSGIDINQENLDEIDPFSGSGLDVFSSGFVNGIREIRDLLG